MATSKSKYEAVICDEFSAIHTAYLGFEGFDGSMLKKRAKNEGSQNLGASKDFEIHFFVPGNGFVATAYSAESKELALGRFKAEFPKVMPPELLWSEGRPLPAIRNSIWSGGRAMED